MKRRSRRGNGPDLLLNCLLGHALGDVLGSNFATKKHAVFQEHFMVIT